SFYQSSSSRLFASRLSDSHIHLPNTPTPTNPIPQTIRSRVFMLVQVCTFCRPLSPLAPAITRRSKSTVNRPSWPKHRDSLVGQDKSLLRQFCRRGPCRPSLPHSCASYRRV